MPNKVNTGEQYGSDEKVDMSTFPLGSDNNWNVCFPIFVFSD